MFSLSERSVGNYEGVSQRLWNWATQAMQQHSVGKFVAAVREAEVSKKEAEVSVKTDYHYCLISTLSPLEQYS
jgi:hypothetical protein